MAGGYVAPFVTPAPMAAPASPSLTPLWVGLGLLALVALLAGRHHDRNGSSNLPDEPGEACFREGTQLQTRDGWTPVEQLAAGDVIVTSRGPQIVRDVSSWQPVDRRDRAYDHGGVWLSGNHRVLQDGHAVAVRLTSARRRMIDGARYFHVLVDQHAWLNARADEGSAAVSCESLMLTADIPLSQRFPHLVARHAQSPVAPLVDNAEDLSRLSQAPVLAA